MSDRPGFVSVSGIAIAAATLAGMLAWTVVSGPVLLSPGSLSTQARGPSLGGVASHARIPAAGCGACHTAPWSPQIMADRCLVCHRDVTDQIQGRSGLHGRLVGAQSSPTCRGCHTDHNGPAGALTVGGPGFPHELTGFSLRGHQRTAAGARVTCAQCHPKGLAQFDPATCGACHATLNAGFMTQHEATFGPACVPCHDGADRYGADFDHNRFAFKLTGKHVGLACQRCHTNAASVAALQATPQTCYACHAKDDRHAGRFGQQCGQCHTAATWANATFDHSIFPVDHGSREQTSTCQTCHPTDVSSYTCFGCHRHTPANVVGGHEGRSLAQLTDCIRCHAGGRREGGDGGGGFGSGFGGGG